MRTLPIPTGPAPAAESPPGKRSARPTATKEEHADTGTAPTALQESALAALCKSWMRAGATDRRLFLSDVRAGNPNLWRAVERDATGGRGQ